MTAGAAIGLRAHSGWAALVAVSGTREGIEVVARRRVEIADLSIPGSRQPYHEAEGMPVEQAAKLLERCGRGAGRLAREALRETVDELSKKGLVPRACGLLLASGRPLPGLGEILASHALIHTADGEHFRDALARASEGLGLPVVRMREKEAAEKASAALGLPAGRLQSRIQALGKALGPPWTQDQKLATIAAWVALCARKR